MQINKRPEDLSILVPDYNIDYDVPRNLVLIIRAQAQIPVTRV